MLVMTSGCLCCSIRGDLVATLEDALRRRDNGRMTPFTRVLIETTGLADPAPVLHTVMAHPYLRLRFKLQAVLTVVDAVLGEADARCASRGGESRSPWPTAWVLAKADLCLRPNDSVGAPPATPQSRRGRLLARRYGEQ